MALVLAAPAGATITAPPLELTAVEATPDPGGPLVRVEGTFPYEALAAQAYPLMVFIRQTKNGNRFVRLTASWGATQGDDPRVKNGAEDVLDEIVWSGMPTQDARFVRIAPGVIELQLPPDFPIGPAEAQIFVDYQGEPLYSNPLPFLVQEVER